MLSFLFLTLAAYASCIFQLGGATFDFSQLIGQDLKYKIGEGPGFYRVSVCSNLMDPCTNGIAPTATPYFGSLYVYSSNTMCQPISSWNPMNMMVAPLSPVVALQAQYGTGVTFLFTDPTGCNGQPMKTQYNMMCDIGSDTGHISITSPSQCAYVVNWPTKMACAFVNPGTQPHSRVPQTGFQTQTSFGLVQPQNSGVAQPQVADIVQPQMPTIPLDLAPSIPVTEKPIFPSQTPKEFTFFGDFIGNATCSEPVEDCFDSATPRFDIYGVNRAKFQDAHQAASVQLECSSCDSCALVFFASGNFYSAKIDADVCTEKILAGSLISKENLNGYIYMHSYHNRAMVKGTLDIEPFQNSKWDIVLKRKEPKNVPRDALLQKMQNEVDIVEKHGNGGRLLRRPRPHRRSPVISYPE